MIWLAALAVLLIVIGLVFLRGGETTRQEHGLSQGKTLALDTRTFYSAKYGLAGRPDRLFRDGGCVIPEEWKKSPRVYDSHRARLATYFVLIEEEIGIAPPYGVIVLGDGSRVEVRNTPELRAWVLDVAEKIRATRKQIVVPIPVRQPAGKCRACGMRDGCGMRAGERGEADRSGRSGDGRYSNSRRNSHAQRARTFFARRDVGPVTGRSVDVAKS